MLTKDITPQTYVPPQNVSHMLHTVLSDDYQLWAVNPSDGRYYRIVQADDEGMIPGPRGSLWFTGRGPPPNPIPGSQPLDCYLQLENGNIWQVF